MSMLKTKTPVVRSAHDPKVRDGLCRKIRSKGMIVNIDEKPENDSTQRQYLAWDKNALPWDSTVWWCQETCTPVGPDDRPCHKDRCVAGRSCYEAPDTERVA
jgi:hypothetical protein